MSYASDYKRKGWFDDCVPKLSQFVRGAKVIERGRGWVRTRPPTGRIWRFRIWLIEVVLLRVVCPLAGRPIQVIRQDESSGGLHHAPACGANHYHHARPITTACTCGAQRARDRRIQGEIE